MLFKRKTYAVVLLEGCISKLKLRQGVQTSPVELNKTTVRDEQLNKRLNGFEQDIVELQRYVSCSSGKSRGFN